MKTPFIVITHYQRLLDYMFLILYTLCTTDRIVKSGGKKLALELEEKGYEWIKEQFDD